jgi:aryl-alcohol dehydrogenase-like predicted oxidoreductase
MGGHGWGRVEESELVAAVHAALDLGVRLFDTSDIYGLGASETILGRALAGRRSQAVISTKFGVRREAGRTFHDTSAAWMRSAVDGSLARLGTDCIDLYQMHYWDRVTPLDSVIETLESLVTKGKIRAFGITNHDPRDSRLRERAGSLSSFSFQYSLVDRDRERDILAVQESGAQVFMSWGSLGQGVLSGKYSSLAQLDSSDRRQRKDYPNFHGDRFGAILRMLDGLKAIAEEAGARSTSQVALRWVVDRIPRALPLVGIKRPEQIADAAGILHFKLEPETLRRLDILSAQVGSAQYT